MVRDVLKRSWISLVFALLATGSTMAQKASLETFLKEKQVWNEKLIVVYAPAGQQPLVQEQLNIFQSYTQTFREEKVVVVPLPQRLSRADHAFLKSKLHLQADQFTVWVIDERGTLRLLGTRPAQPDQVLRLLNLRERPQSVVRAQLFW